MLFPRGSVRHYVPLLVHVPTLPLTLFQHLLSSVLCMRAQPPMSRDQLIRSPHGSSHTEKSHLLYTCAFDIIQCLPVLLEMGGGRSDASARRASESRNPLANFSSNWTWASLASRICHLLFSHGSTGNRDQDAPPLDALECATLLVSMQPCLFQCNFQKFGIGVVLVQQLQVNF